jgi:uncharacterized integral membrane protein
MELRTWRAPAMLWHAMYVILLLVVFALLGVFAVQNGGTQDFSLLGYTWNLPLWAPTAIGTAAASVLLMLHMSHAGLGSRFREIGFGREIDEHRDRIDALRDENARLREELAAARGQVRGAAAANRGPQQSFMDSLRAMTDRVRGRTSTTT